MHNDNQFFCNERQAQQGRKRDKSSEAKHFAEHPLLTLHVIGHLPEHRLCHPVDHARYELLPHATPLVGLVIIPHLLFGIQPTQQNRKQVIVDMIEDISHQQFPAEAKHLTHR